MGSRIASAGIVWACLTGNTAVLGTDTADKPEFTIKLAWKKNEGESVRLEFLTDRLLLLTTAESIQLIDSMEKGRSKSAYPSGPFSASARSGNNLWIAREKQLIRLPADGSGKPTAVAKLDSAPRAMAVSGGRWAGISGDDSKLEVRNSADGTWVSGVDGPAGAADVVSRNHGRLLTVTSSLGTIRSYASDPQGRPQQVWSRRVIQGKRIPVAVSDDNRYVIAATGGKAIVIEGTMGILIQTFDRVFGEPDVSALSVAPNNRVIAVGLRGPNSRTRVFEIATTRLISNIPTGEAAVSAVAFSPSSDRLAIVNADGELTVRTIAVPVAEKLAPLSEAFIRWESLSGVEVNQAWESMAAEPAKTLTLIKNWAEGIDSDARSSSELIKELDSPEFRKRDAAYRKLLAKRMSALPELMRPDRTTLGAEGEDRCKRLINSILESYGPMPENGIYGDELRMLRSIQWVESRPKSEALPVLEQLSKVKTHPRAARSAAVALALMK